MPPVSYPPIPELYVSPDAAEKLTEEAWKLPNWVLTAVQLCDLELLMNGGFYPLRGFMTQADYSNVLREGRLSSGAVWPVPITLEVSDKFAARIEPGDDISLMDPLGDHLAIMSVTDHWQIADKVNLGGRVKGLRRPEHRGDSPNQLRQKFTELGSDVVVYVETAGKTSEAVLVMAVAGLTGKEEAIRHGHEIAAAYDHANLAVVNLADRSNDTQILRALVARNYGATHVIDTGIPKVNGVLEAGGLQILQAKIS